MEVWCKNKKCCKAFCKKLCEWFRANDADQDYYWEEDEFVNANCNPSNKQFCLDLFGCENKMTKEQLSGMFKMYDVCKMGKFSWCDVVKIHCMWLCYMCCAAMKK